LFESTIKGGGEDRRVGSENISRHIYSPFANFQYDIAQAFRRLHEVQNNSFPGNNALLHSHPTLNRELVVINVTLEICYQFW
ncbi:hypothetical protein PENTCL1PPCAC_19707, partial [Pristionchus entomophagus]